MIEEAESRAGDMRDHAVEDFSSALVGVEAVPQEMPQAASALRRAEGQRAIDERLAIVLEKWIVLALSIFERGDNIAYPGQARALDERPLGFIDNFVNPAGLE